MNSPEKYRIARDEYYSGRNFDYALSLFEEIVSQFPDLEEAECSKAFIEKIGRINKGSPKEP